jgi:5-methylcytosine-specific restriction protein B
MDIKDYVKKYSLPFDKVKNDFKEDFDSLYSTEKERPENLEGKIHSLKNKDSEEAIKQVIQILKGTNSFKESDTPILSIFIGNINTIVRIANRINNFKEETKLDNDNLRLYDFFNAIKCSDNLQNFNYQLNSNLLKFLPHIFSVIKHCQNPNNYPIYYKYWKNILREVLSKKDDYDSMCAFYKTFPSENRHLNFATYLDVIGIQIAKNINKSGIKITKDSKDYKYLTTDVINIKRYKSILDSQLSDTTNNQNTSKKYWLYAPGENAYKWDEFYELDIMALGWDELEDIRQYNSREEIKEALVEAYGGEGSKKNDVAANYDFVHTINIGDIIIVKKGRGELLGFGEVTSNYIYDENRSDYNSIRRVDWKLKGNWRVNFRLVMKTLTDITSYHAYDKKYNTSFEELLGIMTTENPSTQNFIEMNNFPLNSILYGPPGTGKTYNSIDKAVAIATGSSSDHISNKKQFDELRKQGQIEFVTFHQNYSYEDFMVGIRPNVSETTSELSFKKHYGIFYEIAKRARENYDNSLKDEQIISRENWVNEKFEEFKEYVESEIEENGKFAIKHNVSIYSVEDEVFIYTGEKENGELWKNQRIGMHYDALINIYLADVQNRQDIKKLENVPSLEKQHATYSFELIEKFRQFLIEKGYKFQSTTVQKEPLKNFVLIIDEINRANISKVFGELITLLEDDKRLGKPNELKITLPNGEKEFGVPPNLYLIGTMNTADKSIALIDIALRRRFEFIGYYPDYENEKLKPEAKILLQKINEEIYKLKNSADYLIGHAYFMKDEAIETTLRNKVVPLLLEYFSGKTKIVSDIFNETTWKVEYDTTKFNWTISLR